MNPLLIVLAFFAYSFFNEKKRKQEQNIFNTITNPDTLALLTAVGKLSDKKITQEERMAVLLELITNPVVLDIIENFLQGGIFGKKNKNDYGEAAENERQSKEGKEDKSYAPEYETRRDDSAEEKNYKPHLEDEDGDRQRNNGRHDADGVYRNPADVTSGERGLGKDADKSLGDTHSEDYDFERYLSKRTEEKHPKGNSFDFESEGAEKFVEYFGMKNSERDEKPKQTYPASFGGNESKTDLDGRENSEYASGIIDKRGAYEENGKNGTAYNEDGKNDGDAAFDPFGFLRR